MFTNVSNLFAWAFDEKGKLPIWGPFAWMSLVVVYLAIVMICAGPLGLYMGGGTTGDVSRYPYTFLDPGISGAGNVAIFCVVMLVGFVALGYVLVGLDRLLARAIQD